MNSPNAGMLLAMLDLQDGMNKKIDNDWLSKRHAYLRAVLVEATEALEHYGWKWWKQQTPDRVQLRIEMIDIWHFILSEYLLRAGGDKAAAVKMITAEWQQDATLEFDGTRYDLNALDIRRQLELLAALAAVRRLCMPLVARLFAACELPPAALFRDYVSKNVLNHFRQDRGYKRGEYKKLWAGAEDNVHMAEILQSLDAADEHLPDALYRALAERYEQMHAAGKLA
ncbi:MAG TPA: dUTP diphosphatase [Burkholderiales bacterium]|nr:dUTP diphosphatase [Burkholderiales bacterium]